MTTALATLSEQFAAFNSETVNLVTTIQGDDVETKFALVELVENAKPIGEHVGETINLVDVVVERAEFTNDTTGEIVFGARVTLIDADGSSYVASSKGVLNSVQRLLSLAGYPSTWGKPRPLKVVQRGKAPKAYYTFEYVKAPVGAK